MSLRRFCGWEPREFTQVVEFTAEGWPVKSVTRREVEWDDAQRLWMLALAHFEAGMCKRCGHHLSETTDPDTDPNNMYGARGWAVEDPVECFSCRVLAMSERRWSEALQDSRVTAPEAMIHISRLVGKTPRMRPGQ